MPRGSEQRRDFFQPIGRFSVDPHRPIVQMADLGTKPAAQRHRTSSCRPSRARISMSSSLPHLGPIRPMAEGGHLGPLSYLNGYRGGVGRSGVGQDTTREDDIEIRARDGRYELILWRCAAGFGPKSAISEIGRCGSTEKRAIGGKKSLRYGMRLGGPR